MPLLRFGFDCDVADVSTASATVWPSHLYARWVSLFRRPIIIAETTNAVMRFICFIARASLKRPIFMGIFFLVKWTI